MGRTFGHWCVSYAYVYTYVWAHTHTWCKLIVTVYKFACIQVYRCVYIYVCICMYICTHIIYILCMSGNISIYMYTYDIHTVYVALYIYICVYMYTYNIHTVCRARYKSTSGHILWSCQLFQIFLQRTPIFCCKKFKSYQKKKCIFAPCRRRARDCVLYNDEIWGSFVRI